MFWFVWISSVTCPTSFRLPDTSAGCSKYCCFFGAKRRTFDIDTFRPNSVTKFYQIFSSNKSYNFLQKRCISSKNLFIIIKQKNMISRILITKVHNGIKTWKKLQSKQAHKFTLPQFCLSTTAKSICMFRVFSFNL